MTTDFRKFFKNRAVLITGGLGFVGSNLARRLVQYGAKVTLVDSMISDYGGNLFNVAGIEKKVHLNFSDIRDRHSIDYLVKGQEIIFNLAGQVSHIDSMKDPFTDLDINCRAQLSLLEACRYNNPKVKVIFAGTRQVYGVPTALPVDEKHLLQPTDVNGINNMAGEWYHILYYRVYGLRTVSLRMTNTYGPRQLLKHNRQGFIGWFIRQIIDGGEISLFGDGLQKRDMNYVEDVVDAFLLAAASDKADGQIYNLGSPAPVTLKDIVETLVRVAKRGKYHLVPFPAEKKRIDIGSYYADYSKIRKELGWNPKVSLRSGLEKTVEYYKKNRKFYWE